MKRAKVIVVERVSRWKWLCLSVVGSTHPCHSLESYNQNSFAIIDSTAFKALCTSHQQLEPSWLKMQSLSAGSRSSTLVSLWVWFSRFDRLLIPWDASLITRGESTFSLTGKEDAADISGWTLCVHSQVCNKSYRLLNFNSSHLLSRAGFISTMPLSGLSPTRIYASLSSLKLPKTFARHIL